MGPDYEIDVYAALAPARDRCADAYRVNTCGVVTAVFGRWGGLPIRIPGHRVSLHLTWVKHVISNI